MAQEKKREKIVAGSVPLGASYWDRTSRIETMGQTPQCCGKAMVAIDDYGRFVCFSCNCRTSL